MSNYCEVREEEALFDEDLAIYGIVMKYPNDYINYIYFMIQCTTLSVIFTPNCNISSVEVKDLYGMEYINERHGTSLCLIITYIKHTQTQDTFSHRGKRLVRFFHQELFPIF